MQPFLEEQALYDQLGVVLVAPATTPAARMGIHWSGAADVNGWRTDTIEQAIGTRLAAFVCPSSEGTTKLETESTDYDNWTIKPATSNYAMVAGHRGPQRYNVNACRTKLKNSGMFLYKNSVKVRHIKDGLSKTIAVGETRQSHKHDCTNSWSYFYRFLDSMRVTESPLNTECGFPGIFNINGSYTNGAFGSEHTGGGNFVYADGHVDFIEDGIDQEVYENISMINSVKSRRDDESGSGFCRN